MSDLIFNAPWWLPAVLAGIGIFVFWTGNRRQEPKVRNGGLALVAASLAVLALSYFVDTALEKAITKSKQLVYAVEKRDWVTLNAILSPNVSLSMFGSEELYGNRNELVAAAQEIVDRYGVKNIRILSTEATETDTLISITMLLMSEQDFTQGRPITSSWKFEWQRGGDAWALEHITCLKVADMTGERAAQQFPRPK